MTLSDAPWQRRGYLRACRHMNPEDLAAVLSAGLVILILKIAVVAVTVLLVLSLAALWRGNYRLHGQINKVFFALTLTALMGLEVVARLLAPDLFSEHFDKHDAWAALSTHLAFAVPAALLLLAMLLTGVQRRRTLHIALGMVFLGLWTGTFVTGVFFLPHDVP
jgi:hypothetical protein